MNAGLAGGAWRLFYFRLFKVALDELEAFVVALAERDPVGYTSHPRAKLLASVYKAITQVVPANRDAPEFRLRHSLGPEYANWRRVKRGLPASYRLFFRFASAPVRLIVYAWMNDDDTLRKQGAQTDVYALPANARAWRSPWVRRRVAAGVGRSALKRLVAGILARHGPV